MIFVLTNLVSVSLLVWSLRGAHLGELKEDLATMSWGWVGVAIAADVGVYTWQAWRWSLLLRPVEPASIWQTVRAIYVGLFANEVLPLRAGEVVRCYLISRWTELPLSVSLSSAIIERIFDGIWLCACLVLTLRIVPQPAHMRLLLGSEYALVGAVFLGALLLAVAMFQRHRAHAALSRGPDKAWRRHLRVLIDDLSVIGHSRYLYFAFLQSLPYLLLQVIPIYASFKGYGFDTLALRDAFALMIILRVGSVVPQAPGNLGVFQFLTIESMIKIFNVVPDQARRFSLVLWGIVTLPLLIGGALALAFMGKNLGELRRAANEKQAELTRSRE